MQKLDKDWITSGLIDFEYKKYVLLAYLQHVQNNFDEARLYPFLSDLIAHYQDARSFKNRKTLLKSGFPKEITKIDLEQLKLSYESMTQDSELMEALEEIVEYALPEMKATLGMGKELYDTVESDLHIEPVGIVPLYRDEGYVMLEMAPGRKTDIYQYKISKFMMSGEGFRSIYLKLIKSMRRGLGETFEGIKLGLIKTYKTLPNPATFLLQAHRPYPVKETVVPIAKRLVLQTVREME
ncbi:MAG: hypothetical protein Roseis2KO_10050 [Roseivirga sp.]